MYERSWRFGDRGGFEPGRRQGRAAANLDANRPPRSRNRLHWPRSMSTTAFTGVSLTRNSSAPVTMVGRWRRLRVRRGSEFVDHGGTSVRAQDRPIRAHCRTGYRFRRSPAASSVFFRAEARAIQFAMSKKPDRGRVRITPFDHDISAGEISGGCDQKAAEDGSPGWQPRFGRQALANASEIVRALTGAARDADLGRRTAQHAFGMVARRLGLSTMVVPWRSRRQQTADLTCAEACRRRNR